jgi:hypothetical protein
MENVAPSGALARRSRQWLQLAFLIVTGGVFIAVIGLALFVIPLAVEGNRIFGFYNFVRTVLLIVGALLGLAGVGLAARAYLTRVDNDLAQITGQQLSRHFDDNFWFVRNINKKGLGYIDAVMVGPPGALVFRIVDNQGVFANERGNWLTQNRSGEWVPWKINPTEEDIVDIKALREYLRLHGMPDVPVYGVVVFVREEPITHIVTKEPTVPAAHLSRAVDVLRDNYLARDRIDQATVRRIVDLIYEH